MAHPALTPNPLLALRDALALSGLALSWRPYGGRENAPLTQIYLGRADAAPAMTWVVAGSELAAMAAWLPSVGATLLNATDTAPPCPVELMIVFARTWWSRLAGELHADRKRRQRARVVRERRQYHLDLTPA